MDIDPTTLGAVLFVSTPVTLLILRIFVLPDGASLDDFVAPLMDLEWPHGVQEEESVRWRVELLTPPERQVAAPNQLPAVRAENVDGADRGLQAKPAA